MLTLVCTDIFGLTPELLELLDDAGSPAKQFKIVDPYAGEHQNFQSEEQAYSAFQESGGLAPYIRQIRDLINGQTTLCNLLGFSVGGAACWKALDESQIDHVGRFLAFYPGQIRHYLDVFARVPSNILFPATEVHFDLLAVKQTLEQDPNVSIQNTEYQHGFMNRRSQGYSEKAYRRFIKQISDI